MFVLAFLVVVFGGSLALGGACAGAVGGGASFAPVSRESMLLANNILLVVAMASVLLGTLYPLFLDALNMGKISVGPPYFEAVFGPLMAPLVFLMGVGPIASWRRAELPDLWTRLRWALGVAIAAALVLPFALGRWTPLVAGGLFLALWVFAATIAAVAQRLRGSPQPTLAGKLRANSPAWYGMLVAHLGIGVFIVGVTLVKGYEVERDVRLAPGESAEVGGWSFTFKGVEERPGPNYRALAGTVEVRRGGALVDVLRPEKRVYAASGQPMTEAAIDTRLTGDLYVSLGEPVTQAGPAGAWGVRIYVKPFVDWIWGGCLMMAIGGFLAISDRRYRIAVKERVGAAFAAART